MPDTILVIIEQREGKLNRVSWETVTAGQAIAAATGWTLEVAVVGGKGLVELRPQPIGELGGFGGLKLGPVGFERFRPDSLVARQDRLQVTQADAELAQRHRDRQPAGRRASGLRGQRSQSPQS